MYATLKKGMKYVLDSNYRFLINGSYTNLLKNMPDEEYLKKRFRIKMGKELNLDNPQSFNEKLQWLKLHDRNPLYTTMVDKYAVKLYVSKLIGDEYIIPTLEVWDSVDEIEFNALPNKFVLKCTHDSGSIIIVEDKGTANLKKIKKHFRKYMNKNHYYVAREWPYKNVKPRIIAEKYISDKKDRDLKGEEMQIVNETMIEYKVTCFNGKMEFITICTGPAHTDPNLRTNDSYDINFKHLPWYVVYKNSPIKQNKPVQWEQIIKLSEKIAKDIPYLRVDWYLIGDKLYFGENTFYTWGGFNIFHPSDWDMILGQKLDITGVKKN